MSEALDEDAIDTIPPPPGVTGPCFSLFCTGHAEPGTRRCARHSDSVINRKLLDEALSELDAI